MNKPTQAREQSGNEARQPEGGGSSGYGTGSGAGDGRPKPDPDLTRRLEALVDALGTTSVNRRRPLNWSGVDDTTVAFESIKNALEASFPGDRPTSDLPQTYRGKQAGS